MLRYYKKRNKMMLYRNKKMEEHYERKNLLQCRRHCKDARCEQMNKELAGKGFLTIAGKIPVEYFREKWYGGAKEVSA